MNNPCPKCEHWQVMFGCQRYTSPEKKCVDYIKYLSYQEGLAEAKSRVKAREREIVEWLKDHDLLFEDDYLKKYGQKLLDFAMEHHAYETLEAWLKE